MTKENYKLVLINTDDPHSAELEINNFARVPVEGEIIPVNLNLENMFDRDDVINFFGNKFKQEDIDYFEKNYNKWTYEVQPVQHEPQFKRSRAGLNDYIVETTVSAKKLDKLE
tara:strand:+ start:551 stop:889 length:339 start_codon:yes stop_codon:yes gene_type:complete